MKMTPGIREPCISLYTCLIKYLKKKSDFKHTEIVFTECVKTALQCESVTRGVFKYYIKATALDTILNILNRSKCRGYQIALV